MTWQKDAACAEAVAQGWAEPDMWFPRPGGRSDKALAICHSCPVAAECLTHVESLSPNEQLHGIWGGTTGIQRIRRRKIRYTTQIKTCQQCGEEFARSTTQSLNQWANRKYCSQDCSHTAHILHRRVRLRVKS